MLWYKSWLETRWRFLIGLVLLRIVAAGTVFDYPQVLKLLPLMPTVNTNNEVEQRIKEIGDLSRTYGGYI